MIADAVPVVPLRMFSTYAQHLSVARQARDIMRGMTIVRLLQQGAKTIQAAGMIMFGATLAVLGTAMPSLFHSTSEDAQTLTGTGLAEADAPSCTSCESCESCVDAGGGGDSACGGSDCGDGCGGCGGLRSSEKS